MGTPGDKAEIRKVVQSQQLDSEQHIPSIIPSSSPSSTSLTSSSVPQLHQSSPSRTTTITTASIIRRSTALTTTTTDMGVINRWPLQQQQQQLESVASSFQLSSVKSENFPTTSTTSLGGLEQAHIEDYYTQTKYYPSSTESLQILYPALPQKQQQQQLQQQQQQDKTFRSLDEPGPSGLQTTSTPKKIGTRVGRRRKSSTITAITTAATTGTEEDFEQQQPQKRVHTCSVCQKNFANIEKLTKHQQIHTGVSPFKCEHCKKTFTSKFKLVRHTLIHSDQKPFNCTVCERTFHRKDHLKNHIKVHSPSKKVYICEKSDCKKEYTSQMSFRKHQALHAAEEGSLQCQICLSIFKTKDDILYHLKVHAGSRTVKNPSEKKFTCDKCERKFFTKKDVRRHMVVHTGMRDFLCQFCPQRFGRKDHLVRHIKKSHSKNLPTGDLETAIKTEKTSDSRRNIITKPETIVKPIKTEVDIKTEFTETVTNPSAEFNFTLDLLPEETFDQLLQREFLPSTSTQANDDDDDDVSLKDLSENLLFKSSSTTTTATKEEEQEDDQQQQQTEQQSQSFDETILQNISETTTIIEANLSDPGIISESVLNDPAIQRLLQPTEEKNLPLPGFSQTFQSPPPPPPP